MEKTAKLIITDSYFNIFPLLAQEIKGKPRDIACKNLVFCEDKISLMAERRICDAVTGTFNTDVYSFGNYLRLKKPLSNVLSKEGSAMAVKRIINTAELKCFAKSKQNLAPSLFDLIIQLKSAKVTPSDLLTALENTSGILKNKLCDIYTIYSEYENFLVERGFDDQSSLLTYLPPIIETDESIRNVDVYLIGYTAWTSQARSIVKALLSQARSVTAILTAGENRFLYVNETANSFRDLCRETGVKVIEKVVDGEFIEEGKILVQNLFNPKSFNLHVTKTDKVFLSVNKNLRSEVETVAESIKRMVIDGKCRYRDVTIALPNVTDYGNEIRSVFSLLKIPYFLDEKKKADNHPLVSLIKAYAQVFTKNRERNALSAFFKNPLFCPDKTFTDGFENYLIKYNINYSDILEPFEFGFDDQETLDKYQAFRQKICSFIGKFDVRDMMERLDVKNGLIALGERLLSLGERVEAEVNAQVYDAVISVLDQMQMLLSGVELSVYEFKKVFESGISALELSVIPQYGDAVFIGGYKEVALAKAGYLFALGLTSGVPIVSEDVALLSDGDINKLSEIKILVEPKIKVVNHRTVENTGMGLASFSRALILSFPLLAVDGTKTVRSEILRYAERLFTVRAYKFSDDFLTREQGLNSFSRMCGDFAEGRLNDFSVATAYYGALEGDSAVKSVLENANKEIKIRLDGENRSVIDGVTSPTTIEDYYTCPYMAFAKRALKLTKREEGVVNALSVGTLMHEIFNHYAERVGEVSDKESSDRLVDEIVALVVQKTDYARYIKDAENDFTLSRVLSEAKKFCFRIYNQYKNSEFKFYKAEQGFEIPLKSGIKLRGKIDRIDAYDGYCRIIDYKTGKPDGSEKSLFAGVKLQLYLYAVSQADLKTAGVYYQPVSDEYKADGAEDKTALVGKTLNDQKIVLAQDKSLADGNKGGFIPVAVNEDTVKHATDSQVLEGLKTYALKMCEQGAIRMQDGVIVPSPYDNACAFCEYKGMCGGEFSAVRKLRGVDENIIYDACKGEE